MHKLMDTVTVIRLIAMAMHKLMDAVTVIRLIAMHKLMDTVTHSYKTDWLPATHLFFDFVTGQVNAKTLSKQFKAAEKQAVRRNQVSILEHQGQCYCL